MITDAITNAMDAYNMLHNRTSDIDGVAREKVTNYLCALLEFGETDSKRLSSMGLLYLTDLDETDNRFFSLRHAH